MPDWSKSMQQTFEYCIVDPNTWEDIRKINTITTCTIDRDSEVETLGSASMGTTETMSECYVRVYLITIQNRIQEKHPLGTFLVQTPSTSFNGKTQDITMDAYTPLLELKENSPPIGYFINKGENIMELACRLCQENVRAPVVFTESTEKLYVDFVSDTNDTWMSFLKDLIANAKYSFSLDELGRILFSPNQDTASLQPIWTFDDSNSSILYPDVSVKHDIYGIPNAVEVIYSNGDTYCHVKVVNDDENSPISTVNRGREICYRDTEPKLILDPSVSSSIHKEQLTEYAKRILSELSTIEYTVTYTHGYCPVRIGDCVRLDYSRAGLNNVKAKVISQSIKCEPGCPVTEKAVFTTKLWR